mmetsp:Transcript_40554/g.52229  ORF Transcript_40554/g.52229 Transcript_40554/m.52229 type:complete len:180 (-) Transcript_40554:429-968(-)
MSSLIQNLEPETSDKLKNDSEFILAALLGNDGVSFQYASRERRGDKSLVLKALDIIDSAMQTTTGHPEKCFPYISDELKKDREVVIAFMKRNGLLLKFVIKEFKNDYEIVSTAIKHNGSAFNYASKTLKNDPNIIILAISNGLPLYNISDKLKNEDRTIAYAAVKKGHSLGFFKYSIKR